MASRLLGAREFRGLGIVAPEERAARDSPIRMRKPVQVQEEDKEEE